MNLVLTWSFPDPGTLSPTGPHLDLVILVPIWASPSPGDFVPHLDLIAVHSFLASPGTGDSDSICASPSHGDFVPHVDLIAVDSFLASPGTGDSDPICASTRSDHSPGHRSSPMDNYDLDTLFHT